VLNSCAERASTSACTHSNTQATRACLAVQGAATLAPPCRVSQQP
jgi:hypothetical protein